MEFAEIKIWLSHGHGPDIIIDLPLVSLVISGSLPLRSMKNIACILDLLKIKVIP